MWLRSCSHPSPASRSISLPLGDGFAPAALLDALQIALTAAAHNIYLAGALLLLVAALLCLSLGKVTLRDFHQPDLAEEGGASRSL